MRKLLTIIIGAVILELIAMEFELMNLPENASVIFGVLAAVLAFVAILEHPQPDERDRMLTWHSSHIALMTVATVLIGLLIYQTIARSVEVWLLIAVVALFIGKIAGYLFVRNRT